jgi:hypothetical protein
LGNWVAFRGRSAVYPSAGENSIGGAMDKRKRLEVQWIVIDGLIDSIDVKVPWGRLIIDLDVGD